jgi:hypothetical protein
MFCGVTNINGYVGVIPDSVIPNITMFPCPNEFNPIPSWDI